MKTRNKIGIVILFLLISMMNIEAQTDKGFIRQGNNDFKKGEYSEAEIKYRKSLDKEYNTKAEFNLGDALYKQNNFEEAAKAFSSVSERNTTPEIEANSYYNLGNSLMAQEKYAEAFEAYKKSLKLNPDDEDARYNLEYARWKIIKQQEQQNQQNKNQQNQEQQQQEQQQQEQKDQQQQEQEQQQNQEQQQEQRQEQQQQMSKEDAERMLQALENQEKETMDELNEKKAAQMQKRRVEKDW